MYDITKVRTTWCNIYLILDKDTNIQDEFERFKSQKNQGNTNFY
jgi:hypothetical protein